MMMAIIARNGIVRPGWARLVVYIRYLDDSGSLMRLDAHVWGRASASAVLQNIGQSLDVPGIRLAWHGFGNSGRLKKVNPRLLQGRPALVKAADSRIHSIDRKEYDHW